MANRLGRPREADLVRIEAGVITAALDGRPQAWLARQAGISQVRIWYLAHGGRTRRTVYERMRAALPALPPPPANGHGNGQTPAEDGGAMSGPS